MGKSTGVVWAETYNRMAKRWWVRWVLTNCFYIILVVVLGVALIAEKASLKETMERQAPALETYKLKGAIYELLRSKGISLGQGLDIAQAVTDQCRELNLPPGLVLALMKTESKFAINAKSEKGAMGIMQIMPATWDTYVKKLGLGVSAQAAGDPLVNIKVATHILKDFYDTYKTKSRPENEVWKLTLSAYASGPNGGIQHKYVKDVTTAQKEMNKKIEQ
jgi:soluble lytic murein transglycosylase-like protein